MFEEIEIRAVGDGIIRLPPSHNITPTSPPPRQDTMPRILPITLLPLSLIASHALRGSRITTVSRRLQEPPTVSPTRADSTILDISGDNDPQEEGTSGGGGISWLDQQHISATTTPPSTSGADDSANGFSEVTIDNASATSPTNVTYNETDALIDAPAESDQAPLEGIATASATSGITNATPTQAVDGSVAPLDSLEADPSETIATAASSNTDNPIGDSNVGINATDNSSSTPSSGAETTIAPQGSTTISNAQSTTSPDSIGLNDETTPSPIDNSSTSTSSSSTTTPYEDQWGTDVDDETNTGDNQTSYHWFDESDDEERNDDSPEEGYPQQDDYTTSSSYPWTDNSPTDQPTPRPTHQSYTSPTDDILDDESESSQYEFNDDIKNNIQTAEEKVKEYLDGVESPEEMEKDVNVQVVAGVLTFVFVVLWLTTAWQVMENPDGVCAR